jgi:hypothetical protein
MAPQEPHGSTKKRNREQLYQSQIVKVQFPVGSIAEPQLSTGNRDRQEKSRWKFRF